MQKMIAAKASNLGTVGKQIIIRGYVHNSPCHGGIPFLRCLVIAVLAFNSLVNR